MIKFLRRRKPGNSRGDYKIREKGIEGEDEACRFLKKKGYRIIDRNFRTRFGEIDIIAKEREFTVFVEVKLRNSSFYGLPEESVDFRKQKKIIKSAEFYLQKNGLSDTDCRFDVVSICGMENNRKIKLIRNAFEAG